MMPTNETMNLAWLVPGDHRFSVEGLAIDLWAHINALSAWVTRYLRPLPEGPDETRIPTPQDWLRSVSAIESHLVKRFRDLFELERTGSG
jgi:hypothetical protein